MAVAALRALGAWCDRRLYSALLAAAAVALIAWAARDMLARLAYEAHGPLTADTPIYAAIGRGILNHVPLYSGLFETKPPLIFVLFTLSWIVARSWTLVVWAQVAALTAIFVAPVILVLRERSGLRQPAAKVALAVLGGASIALYTAVRSGEIQVESFGAATLLPWVWACGRHPERSPPRTLGRVLAGSGSVALACLFKEPFLFTAIAVGLIHARSRRDFSELSLALGLAGLLDVLVLLVTGTLGVYVGVYLPEMLGHAVFANAPVDTGATLKRALEWRHLWDDLWGYAPGLFVALAGASFSAMASERGEGRPALSILIRWVAALSLCSFAIGLSGNYYNHQFVPAVPFAIAILVTWLGSDDKPSSEMVSFGTAVAILGLATATVSHEQPDLDAQLADLKARKTSAVAAAAQIDRALECTGENSYVFIGTNGVQPYGWTTHSPAGPLFFQYNAWFAPSQGHHREVLLDELKQSRLLVFHELTAGDFNDTLEKAIDARFHPGLPPRCASITLDAPWSFRWAEN